MPYTFLDLKNELRPIIWPQGEAPNLVAAHNKAFVDVLIDLQTWVACLQQDNTQLLPQCSTLFNCGLTVFDAPRGIIRSVSVIDKINQETGLEDATADDDWCSEIFYTQIHPCYMDKFLSKDLHGCCYSLPLYFGLNCTKGRFIPPTDEGLSTLPRLPLGHHYGQASTDDPGGRALSGVWAIERGKIYIAPWIQSTETVVVRWDGIKRAWANGDLIDEDPLLKKAVEEYVRWDHAGKWDKDADEARRAVEAFNEARQMLMHQCREETRVRGCEPSHARSSAVSSTTLYYNEQQQATASCNADQDGDPVTVTIAAGTVASYVSVADANQKALAEANSQAEAQLDCVDQGDVFTNDEQSYTAQCTLSGDPPLGTPFPEGDSVTRIVAAGTVTSTVSKADANAQALAVAQSQAEAALECTYWNAEQSFTAECPADETGDDVTKTIAAHTFSSVISQGDANTKALTEAKKQAELELVCDGGDPGGSTFSNTQQVGSYSTRCASGCIVTVTVTVSAGTFTSTSSQAAANTAAYNYARATAQGYAALKCRFECGPFALIYP